MYLKYYKLELVSEDSSVVRGRAERKRKKDLIETCEHTRRQPSGNRTRSLGPRWCEPRTLPGRGRSQGTSCRKACARSTGPQTATRPTS